MEITQLIDLEGIAKQLKLPEPGVQQAAELLEEGNTVPFIARFRRDQTGGLDEQQIRAIESELKRAKLLAERKETILKSIESRGKLTDKLASQIKKAKLLGDLEDIYLPYKPKKQSLASAARARGLEPLATAVLEAKEATPTLEERAAAFVDESKDVPTVEVAIEGLKHLIAEHFGHHRQVRSQLRRHLSKNGKLVCKKIEEPVEEAKPKEADAKEDVSKKEEVVKEATKEEPAKEENKVAEAAAAATPEKLQETTTESVSASVASASDAVATSQTAVAEPKAEASTPEPAASNEPADAEAKPDVAAAEPAAAEPAATEAPKSDEASAVTEDAPATEAAAPTANASPANDSPAADAPAKEAASDSKKDAKEKGEKKDAPSRRDQRREMRRRRRERLVQSFKDYFDFSDPIGRLPHHRILAINRGERTKVLRVKIECPDWDKVQAQTEKTAFPEDHPYADFLRGCLQDAMQRLLQPSIEREVRRDLNDRAEEHAVKVFARNLRKLLLQPPLRNNRVVAIDPGFRSGCKVVALDEFGQMLGNTFVNLLGKDQQKQNGREALAQFVKEHKATVIAVGNGAASRETETLVAEVLSDELKDQQVGYLIVNEAGTSVYSTSELGREELPDMDATLRSAVSIGRRGLDPLSELVKIDPASIGVGLYQHDVKAKHLRESLDNVVESCVNYVGVNVNSASPALLGYVSGLNSLTARKIYEHRLENGPFKNREQLKNVSGIGDSTYIQAAGFLRIVGGENPLDGTWIHPESYDTATKVLEAIGCSPSDLQPARAEEKPAASPAESSAAPATTETAKPETSSTEVSPAESPAEETSKEPAKTEPSEPKNPAAVSTEAASPTVSAGTEEATPVTNESSESAPQATAPTQTAAPTESETATTEAPATETPATETATTEAVAQPAVAEVPAAEPSSGTTANNARMQEVTEKLSAVDASQLAEQLSVGKLSLEDILKSLARPGRDPREDLPPPIFRTGVLKLEDLKPEMELSGTVLNVVDFGAFVDIGLVDSGLIHVSRLADRFISDPHDIVSVGDILRVWVVEVDQKRRRVSLTAIEPGTEKPKPTKENRRRGGGGRNANGRTGGDASGAAGKTRSGKRQESGKSEGRARGGKKFARGKGQRPKHRSKAPPKPVVPITKEMEDGSEPMRTFGDLKQLFEKKKKRDK